MNTELIQLLKSQINIVLRRVKLNSNIELLYYIKPNLLIEATSNKVFKLPHNNKSGYFIYDNKLKSEYPIGYKYTNVIEEMLIRGLGEDLYKS